VAVVVLVVAVVVTVVVVATAIMAAVVEAAMVEAAVVVAVVRVVAVEFGVGGDNSALTMVHSYQSLFNNTERQRRTDRQTLTP
jgi:hypothetical protein